MPKRPLKVTIHNAGIFFLYTTMLVIMTITVYAG